MSTKYVQSKSATLQSAISDTDTSITIVDFLDLSGNPIVQADIGTTGFGTLGPNTEKEEAISFTIDSNAAGVAVLTVTRGLLGKQPYGTGGTAFAHNAGTEFILSNNPDLLNKLTAKDNDEVVTGGWRFPATPTHDQNPVPKKYLEDNAVMKTGAQTVAGVKTFSSQPVVPTATEPGSPIRKDTFDAQAVKKTGNETIAGVKTFSSAPKVPDAVASDEPYTKGQHDADAEAASAVASTTVRGSAKLDVAADDALDPEVLTATAARAAALSGGGDFGEPGEDNKFVTETFLDNVIDVQEFTASGTWTKPILGTLAIIELIGGGGSGAAAKYADAYIHTSGGGGGAYAKFIVPLSALSATEAVTIGLGGASQVVSAEGNKNNGLAGGTTTFKNSLLQALGGQRGTAANSSSVLSPEPGGAGGLANSELISESGAAGGNAHGWTGGASTAGGSKIFAGAGGGAVGVDRTANVSATNGGTSLFSSSVGGNAAGTLSTGGATATGGVRGGGGGGAAVRNATGTATSGKGGDGFVRVTVF